MSKSHPSREERSPAPESRAERGEGQNVPEKSRKSLEVQEILCYIARRGSPVGQSLDHECEMRPQKGGHSHVQRIPLSFFEEYI